MRNLLRLCQKNSSTYANALTSEKMLARVMDLIFCHVSRSSLGLKSILNMPGLEPGTSRPCMLSECAYHLLYISVDPSAHTHSISAPGPSGSPGLELFNARFSVF